MIEVLLLSIILVVIPGIHTFIWSAETARASGITLLGEATYNKYKNKFVKEVNHIYTARQKAWLFDYHYRFMMSGYIGCSVAFLTARLKDKENTISLLNIILLTAMFFVFHTFMVVYMQFKKSVRITILEEMTTPYFRNLPTILLFFVIVEGGIEYSSVKFINKNNDNKPMMTVNIKCSMEQLRQAESKKQDIKILNVKNKYEKIYIDISCENK